MTSHREFTSTAGGERTHEVVVSGIQPSGTLHLGNYFGALRQHIRLHREHEAFYFIVNYHALTTVHDSERLRRYSLDVALDYL
ncbi:MAG: tryptophan--tRNA ligase, partial [Rhodothermales bacterium]